jgi:hypothetical protein
LTGEEGWKRVREMRDIIEESDEEGGEEEIRMEEVAQEIILAI